ncbi:MAG: hypothetical protein HQL54_06690 [Magnetococcales bacterium]|nr:hypothetical protein [Magnetococcales bacterium]
MFGKKTLSQAARRPGGGSTLSMVAATLLMGFTSIAHAESVDIMIDGAGVGMVTSDPTGIECSNDTEGTGTICSLDVDLNGDIELFADPADGSVFDGWSIAGCTTDACSIHVDGPISVTARFEPDMGAPPPFGRGTESRS